MSREIFKEVENTTENLRISVDRCKSDAPALSMRGSSLLEISRNNNEINKEEYERQYDILRGLAAEFMVKCSCIKTNMSLVKEK